MAIIERAYWIFYLQGRSERKLPKSDLDEADIAKVILETGASNEYRGRSALRDSIYDVCLKAVAPLEVGRTRRQWLEANADTIETAGGDDEAAFSAWLAGRVDEMAYALEEGTIVEMAKLTRPEGEEEEEESEEGDDDDGDDEDGDGEEENDDKEDDDDDEAELPASRPLGRRR